MLPAQRLSGVGQQARPATTEVRPISVRIGSVELRAPAPEAPPAAPAPDVGFGEYLWMRTYAGWQHV